MTDLQISSDGDAPTPVAQPAPATTPVPPAKLDVHPQTAVVAPVPNSKPEATIPATPAAAKSAAPKGGPDAVAPATKKSLSNKTASAKKAAVVAPAASRRPATSGVMDVINRRVREAPGYALSIVMHVAAFFLMSLVVIPPQDREELFNTIMASTEVQPEIVEPLDDKTIVLDKVEDLQAAVESTQINSQVVSTTPSAMDLDISDSAPMIEAPDPSGVGGNGGNGPNMPKGELAGRSKKARGAMLASQGGTPASEVSVNTGLKWLAKHQRPDGSWSFKHGPDDPGSLDNPTGATGLALLAFLGGGHTHKAGDYQKQVSGGLAYLGSKMTPTGDMRLPGDGSGMYTQGICTIALCEAYALSKDKNLRQPTQLAINFIVNAQDPAGGGWRYQPGQKGDTSVVGWQIMALKSAKIAKLQVPNKTIGKATVFLNFVQAEDGAKYGYDVPGAGPGTTAAGLLCRMYLGWTPKNQGLVKGVEYLSKVGPQPGNIYFDYYATQVLHHWGGEPWTKWNNVMREYLVTSQEKSGDAAGSWKPGTAHDDASGGRHYRTCMSVMTLEVYYRHLPIYQRETIKVDF